jgi:hypothetical protein
MLTFCLPVSAQPSAPRVFLLDGKYLQSTRERIRQGDKSLAPALEALQHDAQAALKSGPFSVVDKNITPPSGDKHDFMSQAPYFWPDPQSPNGLPYIRRDGQRNPEIRNIPDDCIMSKMRDDVETLALAYYFTGDEKYAVKAAELLRTWFLDPATRMNPNLQFAQAVPGVNTGRGTGIIESTGLTSVVDSIGLLAGSKAWTESDQLGMEEWYAKYLKWMQESQPGRAEGAAINNHGTFYDMQVASFALFVGKKDLAASVLREAETKRIARQIEPDGRQPLELARTNSWSYSITNLRGLMSLAKLAENVDVDLWNYQTADGRSIHKALDYLLPFAFGEQKWPHQQIGRWSPRGAFGLLRRAALKYPDERYRSLVSKLPEWDVPNWDNLFHPKPVEQNQEQK